MQANGVVLPSQEKTVTVIDRVVVDWSGKERYMKGSKVTETLLHTGQTNVDLYCPCPKVKRQIHEYGKKKMVQHCVYTDTKLCAKPIIIHSSFNANNKYHSS